MLTKKFQKSSKNYCCNICDYNTSRSSQYERHLLTRKHSILTKSSDFDKKGSKLIFACECGKNYKYRQSLHTHKKNCIFVIPSTLTDNSSNPISSNNSSNTISSNNSSNILNLSNEVIFEVVKKQQDQIIELTNTIKELIPKLGNTTITTNNHKFNIQVFLNEKCKDAINMRDFIRSIEVSFLQLDYTKQNGLVNGLSNVIIENMNKLDLYQRPIHCTDIKREILYIKENNEWEKDINKDKIKNVIKEVSTKQFSALCNWTKENPDFQNNESKQNYYTHTLVAIANNKEHNEEKIIKKLCSNSYVKD